MKDYYKTLGIEKAASADEIKKAFRTAAHKYHPDKNKGNEEASKKFKEASEAYSVLSDPQKRSQYDRFGTAGPTSSAGGFNGGQSAAGGFGGFDFSQFTQGGGFGQNGQSFEFDLGDLFGEFFGGGSRRRMRKGANITVDAEISFKESIFGVERDLSVGKEKLSITIPPGIENAQGLRVAGKGEASPVKGTDQDGGPGDLIVRVWVRDDAQFRKEGLNLVMELPVKLTTALAGGTIEIETLDGKIDLKIPVGTSHGEILRIRGKGVPYETRGVFTASPHAKRGDLLIVTHVQMPKKLSKIAQKLVEDLKKEGI